jgi:hypothetical protein
MLATGGQDDDAGNVAIADLFGGNLLVLFLFH